MKRELSITVEVFEKELSYIKDDTIREITAFAIENINSNFFVEPASSTGKYHPEYALGPGGLYRHTQAAVKIANDLLQLDMYKEKFSESVRDYIVAALILHDSCKRGKDWNDKYTKFEHPLIVEDWLKEIFIENKIPKSNRNTYPILTDAKDNILWIPNIKKSKFTNKNKDFCDIILKYCEKEEKNEQ